MKHISDLSIRVNNFSPFSYLICVIICACTANDSATEKQTDLAQHIVDQSLQNTGLNNLDHAKIEFKLRDRDYVYERNGGLFKYTRIFITPEGDTLVDILNNDGLQRWTNGELTDLTEEWRQRYTNSVNGVIYYAFLPYRLNDPSVIKEYLGLAEIDGKDYHKIKVTFTKEGGGGDFEDIYLYWFEEEAFTLDYFAYQYFSEGGGMRFRKAVNIRMINDVTIQDYLNYKPADTSNINIEQIDIVYKNNDLESLSEINLENVKVFHSSELD